MWPLRPWQALALIAVSWTLWLTLYAALAQGSSAVHHDMTEAYAWGLEWPLGTYKHPPLNAWIAGAWFAVWPRSDVNFYALAALNAGIGVVGAYKCCQELVGPARARAALPLLMLTPTFGPLALTFNANTVLLSVWPWTTYAFLVTLRRRDIASGLLFGSLAGLALLGKYYSVLLLASCLAAALLHPERARYFTSRAPYAAILMACLVSVPHAVWSWVNDFPAITYALTKTEQPWNLSLMQAFGTLAGGIGLALIPILALALVQRRFDPGWQRHIDPGWQCLAGWSLVLLLGPIASTLALGLFGRLGISTNFLIPALFVVAPLVVLTTGVISDQVVTTLHRLTAIAILTLLGLAPVLSIAQMKLSQDAALEPRRELALAATALWHATAGSPLKLTAGTAAFGLALPFYSPDRPSDFTDMDPDKAPWVSEARIQREGLLVACLESDASCRQAVSARPPARVTTRTLTLHREFWGIRGPDFTFQITMFAPATALARHSASSAIK